MDKTLIETLGKMIIAVAWADGKITHEETESLKDLLFEFQHTLTFDFNLGEEIWWDIQGLSGDTRGHNSGLSSKQQAMFDMYTESPIEAAERERLVHDLKEAVRSEQDKTLVVTTLKNMAEADGRISDDEQALLRGILAEIESVDTGIFRDLGRLLREAIHRRVEAFNDAPNREKYFEEFLKNKVYYEVRRRLDLGEADLQISDDELRKLSMAGGMMARVSQIDHVVLDEEKDTIMSILQADWGLNPEAAAFVTEVAMAEGSAHFDYLRMSREFLATTQPAERINFLNILFAVANADGRISSEELKEINEIADYLLVRRSRVIDAHSKFNS